MSGEAVKKLKYVEDAETVRVIQEISRRWPAIAAAADHPLTEFFICSGRRDKKKGADGLLKKHATWLAGILLYACLKVNSFSRTQIEPAADFLIIMAGILIFVFMMSAPLRRKQRRELSWQILFSKEDKNRWVWLSGLKLPEYAAIAFTYEYWKESGSHRLRIWYYRIFMAVVFCWTTGLLTFSPRKSLIFQILPIGILYIRSMLNPGIVAVRAITEAEDPMDRVGTPNLGAFITVLVITAFMAIVSTPGILSAVITVVLCALLLILPQAFIRHVNSSYQSLITDEERYFATKLAPERFK